ncbi:AsnC family transcriptional regulator [Pandoraea faecigallinarum]|uniref:AsnC family transcriptional regulator n=1 Tax=Pandoraea faecigallinarum TaxID=656179 RepID=A0A0H3WV25_9BURK|nr:GntR family transcriptional regulator [Pandoraea faecigallinarum]AKM31500.1 AsnC family transcriptional regulator [Pandoraea faecigallinarum]
MTVKPKRSEALRQAIEEKIAVGEYPPGMRLDEVELATAFGVSRTPLREALIQLASSGVIEIRPRRGAVVSQIDPQRLCEMFEVMAELESMCGRLAARRITEDELEALRQTHEASRAAAEARDIDTYYEVNAHFHALIYQASHNAYLQETALQLHRRLRVYRRLQLRVRDRPQQSFAEHDAVFRAIEAGDAEAASEHLRAHVTVQGERFADLMASLHALARKTG